MATSTKGHRKVYSTSGGRGEGSSQEGLEQSTALGAGVGYAVSKHTDAIPTSGISSAQPPGLWGDKLRLLLHLGLVRRQQRHPRGWKSPGHGWSQAWDPGGGSTHTLCRGLQQPAGVQDKWHDDTRNAGGQSRHAFGSKNSLGLCHMGQGYSSASKP